VLIFNGIYRDNHTNYSKEIATFNSECAPIFTEIASNSESKDKIQNIIDKNSGYEDIFIVNLKGEVVQENKNNFEKQIDIVRLLKRKSETNFYGTQIKYYNAKYLNQDRYIVIARFLVKGDNFEIFILGCIVFIIVFFLLTYGSVRYIEILSKGIIKIASGKLNLRVDIKGNDELASLGRNINYMAQRLEEINKNEKEIEKSKNMLIANVSHDLRTPLTSIIGYIKLIREKYIEQDEIHKYITIIDDKSNRLEELINELFEYTKLSSCDVKLNKTKISLNEFIRQMAEEMMPLCHKNNLKIILNMPKEDIMIEADTSKMIRVFENIIANAVRYSEKPGSININVFKSEEKARICVENKGQVIEEKDIEKIFDRFYKTDDCRNTKIGGAGLGLCIAKTIVELHGGNIWAESKKNKVCFNILFSYV
jgi:signal transduction histidine kinase